jgi:hypothetical protein
MATIDRRGVSVDATDTPIAGDPNPGLAIKAPARVATTGNITLSGLQTVDGVALGAGERVLVWQQTDPTLNGLYNASIGPWTRTIDASSNTDFTQGTLVGIVQGTIYQNTLFEQTAPAPVILGTSAVGFIPAGVPPQRRINTTAPLLGGGALSSDLTLSIQPNGITYGLLQQVAGVSLVGNPTGSLATAQGITLGATLAFSGAALRTTALSGDVTSAANSFVTTIAANSVTNAKAAQMGANTIKGNNTGGTANAADLTTAQVTAMLNVATASVKGLVPVLSGVATQYFDGTGAFSAPAGSGGFRTRLTANLTFYVNMSTGNDSTGTGAIGAPFKTLTVARVFAQAKYDLNGFVITFNCDGTTAFTAGLTALGPFVGQAGPSSEVWDFVAGSVVTGPTNGYAILAAYGAKLTVTQAANNLTFATAGGAAGLGCAATDGGFINLINVVSFNTCARSFLQTSWGGTIIYNGAFFTGNCYAPYEVSGGLLQGNPGTTTTYTGNPTIGRAMAWAYNGGSLGLAGMTFTPLGTVTGKRYEAGSGATIATGGSETYFPGTIAGVETGGVYVRSVDQSAKAAPKFWVDLFYNAGVPTARDSHNVSSLTDNGTGLVTVNFIVPFATANWAPGASCGVNSAGTFYCMPMIAGKLASSVQYLFLGIDNNVYDVQNASIWGFGVQ